MSAASVAALLIDRSLWLSFPLAPSILGLGALSLVGALLHAARTPLSALEACQQLDRHGALEGRLANGLALATDDRPLTPFAQEAVRDAARVLERADPEGLQPIVWERGALLRLALFMVLAVVIGLWTPRVAPSSGEALASLRPPSAPVWRVVIEERVDRQELLDQSQRTADEAAQVTDPEVKAWMEDLQRLLDDVAKGTVSPTGAQARLAALEGARDRWEEEVGDLERAERSLREAGKKARSGGGRGAMNTMAEELRSRRLSSAADALRQLGERPRDLRSAARRMERMARELESARQRAERRLKKERSRLQRKEKKGRLNRRERRRLNRNKRELSRLERERERLSRSERQLERLRREMDRAAEAARRRDQQAGQQAAERAADALRRLSQMRQGQRSMRLSRSRLDDLRRILRRAGSRGQGNKGKGGEGHEDARDRFLRLAQGQGAQGQGGPTALLPGGQVQVPGGPGGGQISVSEEGGAAPGQGPGGGDEAGVGTDDNVLGAPEAPQESQTRQDQVEGRDGDGPTSKRAVLGAARRGFTSQGWGAAHERSYEVEEETMERQRIPIGRRRVVREYFDLIRPRSR